MIQIPRSLARQVRAVFRKLAPRSVTRAIVTFKAGPDGLCVRLHRSDILAEFFEPGSHKNASVALPLEALADFEGRDSSPVTLVNVGAGEAQVRWDDGGVPIVKDFTVDDPSKLSPYPDAPAKMNDMPGLLPALAAAAQCAARDNPRYAVTDIQLRGKLGEIVATDGKQLLVQGGFSLPWTDDVLIPSSTVFGCRELQEGAASAGKTSKHVTMQIGQWAFHFPINTEGRYPSIDQVIPNPKKVQTRCRLDAGDVDFLGKALPRLPGNDEDGSPVTIDVGDDVVVRAKSGSRVTEVVLSRSQTTGKPAQIAVDRSFLARAIELGFSELHIVSVDSPMVFLDDSRKFVIMPLGKEGVVPSNKDALRLVSAEATTATKTSPRPSAVERREEIVSTHRNSSLIDSGTSNNGNGNGNRIGHGNELDESHPTVRHNSRTSGLSDLIEEAEALKNVLRDAYTRTHSLLMTAKKQKKTSRIVETTLRSLKELQHVDG